MNVQCLFNNKLSREKSKRKGSGNNISWGGELIIVEAGFVGTGAD